MENPKIRFKGFTKDWEQRKLGDDLVSIHTGTNLLGSITNTGMPLIKNFWLKMSSQIKRILQIMATFSLIQEIH